MNTFLVIVKHTKEQEIELKAIEYQNDFHQFYDELEIDVFDIVRSGVYTPYIDNDMGLLLYVDDNGLLKNSPPTFPTFQQLPDGTLGKCVGMLVGNVAFAHENEFNPEETRGLTPPEANALIEQLREYFLHLKMVVREQTLSPLS